MTHTCPTCGSPVTVEGDDKEGTHYYVSENEALRAVLFMARNILLHRLEECPSAYQTKLVIEQIDEALKNE